MSESLPSPSNPSPDEPVRIPNNPTSARVPERVSRGAIATAFLAFFGPHEFVIDFLQLMSKPQLVARVVMTPLIAEQFLNALRENMSRYTAQFGPPAAMPKAPADAKPKPPRDIYDELKISDDVLTGSYANTVLVGHTPAEFGLDFITTFIPHAAVSARIYLAAPRVPQLIETLTGLLIQYKRQRGELPPGDPNSPGGGGQSPSGGDGGNPHAPHTGPNFGTAPGIPGFPTPPSN